MVKTEGSRIILEGEIVSTTTAKIDKEGRAQGPESVTLKCSKDDVTYVRELLAPFFEGVDEKFKPAILKAKRGNQCFKSGYPVYVKHKNLKYKSLAQFQQKLGCIKGSHVIVEIDQKIGKCIFLRSVEVLDLVSHTLNNFFEEE